MSHEPYFEVVRRDDGWLARFRGGNGHKVFTSELYVRRRAAENAITLIASAIAGEETFVVAWREADERTPPLPPPVIEPPFYVRDVRGEPFWHDSDYHWRHCFGDECTEGAPEFGTEIRGRTGFATFGRGGAS